MSYRGRLTAEVRELLLYGPDRGTHNLTAAQIMNTRVTEVDVTPADFSHYLRVDCTAPAAGVGADVARFSVTLDQATALRVLFNAPLDETNTARPGRRPIRDVTREHNESLYDRLRRTTVTHDAGLEITATWTPRDPDVIGGADDPA